MQQEKAMENQEGIMELQDIEQIEIDYEFRHLNPPLSDGEFKQLEESIMDEGCRDALVVWTISEEDRTILLDGYNRLTTLLRHKEALLKKGINEVRVIGKSFPDRLGAKIWVRKNQLGRRNLTNLQRHCQIGGLYKDMKLQHGGNHGDSSDPGRTAKQIADTMNVSESTVIRAEELTDAIYKITNATSVDVKNKILTKNEPFKGITRTKIIEIGNLEPNDIKEVVKSDKPLETLKKKLEEKNDKEPFKLTEQSYEELEDALPEDTLEQLETLKDTLYTGEVKFLAAIEQTIGSEQTDEYKLDILKSAKEKEQGEEKPFSEDTKAIKQRHGEIVEKFEEKISKFEITEASDFMDLLNHLEDVENEVSRFKDLLLKNAQKQLELRQTKLQQFRKKSKVTENKEEYTQKEAA